MSKGKGKALKRKRDSSQETVTIKTTKTKQTRSTSQTCRGNQATIPVATAASLDDNNAEGEKNKCSEQRSSRRILFKDPESTSVAKNLNENAMPKQSPSKKKGDGILVDVDVDQFDDEIDFDCDEDDFPEITEKVKNVTPVGVESKISSEFVDHDQESDIVLGTSGVEVTAR